MRTLWLERDEFVGFVMLLVTWAPMTSAGVEDPYYPTGRETRPDSLLCDHLSRWEI